jgi:FG-GAP-like repeat/FG-GAP repeat
MNTAWRRGAGACWIFLFACAAATAGGCSSDSGGRPDGATDAAKEMGNEAGNDGGTDVPAVDGPALDTSPGTDAPSDVPATDGGGSDVKDALDLTDVMPPTMLTATVSNRREGVFQLVWTAPSNAGQRVSGYQVRYAKVPITAANFDDTTMTTAVPYTGTPSAPGGADGLLVKLYIENNYYFAVSGTDAAGAHVGALMATSAAVAAHFNVTLISSPAGTNQAFGVTLDGSQDVNGDGISDLLVGTAEDNHAYLFLGGANFAPTAPTVTFTGTNVGFGATVRQIGDIDGDGLQDIAIADRPTGLRVFIYKGRAAWPAALTDAQADYVIMSDATFAGSQFGSAIDRVGDFNGDGVNDMVITAPLYSSRLGRVLVVFGRTGFTSFTAPDMTRALEIGADPALARTQLGVAVVSVGHFYAGTGTTLVVSAPGLAAQPSDNSGRLYAFHGRGPGAPIAATAADHALVGPAAGALIGQQLTNLGVLTGTLASVGASNLSDAASVSGSTGTGFILSGTAATGPFANKQIAYRTGTNLAGEVLFGGGFSGLDTSVSLIGDAKPDVALSGQVGSTLDIIDGARIGSLASPIDTATVADVHVPMPTGWSGTTNGSRSLIKDINNDGYPDFVLGDVFGTVPGRVAVFW